MNNIRAAFITTHFPPSTGFGGVCESSFGLSSALARAGSHIEVVTSDATKNGRISAVEFAQLEEERLKIHSFRYSFANRLCFSLNAKRVTLDVLKNSDIVYVNGIFTYPVTIGARISKQLKKPSIIAIRGGLEPWRFQQKYRKKRAFLNTILKPLLRSADCIHVTSQEEMESCITLGLNGPFTIIPNGINPDEFRNLPEPAAAEELWPCLKNKTIVLFLSRLSKEKGLDMLLEVWGKISPKHPKALLVIAGPDDRGYEKIVHKMIQQKKLSQSVFVPGNATGHKKLMMYSRSDVFILPSYSENFGNVVAEALVCAVPVITTKGTPWKDIEHCDCGRQVPVNAEAIEGAVVSLLKMTPAMRAEMGQRGRNLICKKYTWDIAAGKMLSVYRAILAGSDIPLRPEPFQTKTKGWD
jgi:glycosyltransferase involved in cell wall biosynthesis